MKQNNLPKYGTFFPSRRQKLILPVFFSVCLLTLLAMALSGRVSAKQLPLKQTKSDGMPDQVEILQQTSLNFGANQTEPELQIAKEGLMISTDRDATTSMALGDVDGDGDLDLAVGNLNSTKLYKNEFGTFSPNAVWVPVDIEEATTNSVAWGDVDGDGDLDLAVGHGDNSEPNSDFNKLYLNENGILATTAIWSSNDEDKTVSIAWGDVDGDGDLDLAAGNFGDSNKIYLNDNGTLSTSAFWSSEDSDWTNSVVWGDVDGDGDLDLIAGNGNNLTTYSSQPKSSKIYLNENGTLSSSGKWGSEDSNSTTSMAWGDVDGDGDLDLVAGVGTFDSFFGISVGRFDNKLYLNENGTLTTSAVWNSDDSDRTGSIAWGDADGDGDIDLAVGNYRAANKIYLNEDGVLSASANWSSEDSDPTTSIAWVDVDGNGTLDLIAGNQYERNKVYLNDNISLGAVATWRNGDNSDTRSIAWADVDQDGDLDLAVGNGDFNVEFGTRRDRNRLHLNENGALIGDFGWSSQERDDTNSLAWGDVNGDGFPDLAVGNGGANRLYLNQAGELTTEASWSSNDEYFTSSVAWGDVDGDGYLDLATGNCSGPNQLYLNEGGELTATAYWSSNDDDCTNSVAWGDVDGDGDLDLAAGGTQNKVYLNENGTLAAEAFWISEDESSTNSVAWGDVDGDGDLDLAVGNDSQNKIYLNENGILQKRGTEWSTESERTYSVIWGDVDGDGDLDLAVGNGSQNKIYLNENGTLKSKGIPWSTADLYTTSIAWGDADGDGDLDLAVGNSEGAKKLYSNNLNHSEGLQAKAPYLTIEKPSKKASVNDVFSTQVFTETIIPVPYTLYGKVGHSIGRISLEFSPNGGGQWFPAIAASKTVTNNILISANPIVLNQEYQQWLPYVSNSVIQSSVQNIRSDHVFYWDTFASGVYGQLDNVVLRVVIAPQPLSSTTQISGSYQYPNYTPFPIQRPYASAQTYPFKIRGTQAQVFQESIESENTVRNAQVFRIPAGTNIGEKMEDINGQPFSTGSDGFLRGRGELRPGDHIFAMLPVAITATEMLPLPSDKVELYFTSLEIDNGILKTFEVQEPGIQQLIVSADHPLVLFNLDVSLEWDARQNEAYMLDLRSNLREASRLLFDWTNGQMALGEINIYHNGENWDEADIQILASNRYRPNAQVGGIITEPVSIRTDLVAVTETLYLPGKVRMGSTWNRNGIISSDLGDDWAEAFTHELGHYLLFMDDNYFGYKDGRLIPIDSCTGVMANPYINNDNQGYGEFHSEYEWDSVETCGLTASHLETGRSDWETLTHIYPMLSMPPTQTITSTGSTTSTVIGWQSGPDASPLLPIIKEVKPKALAALKNQTFQLYSQSGKPYDANEQAKAFIIRENQAGETRIIKLGKVSGDQLFARGIQPYDQLCLQNLEVAEFGCKQIETEVNESFDLFVDSVPAWKPDITIRPVTSTTIDIKLTLPASSAEGQIFAQLIPAIGDQTPVITLTQPTDEEAFEGTFSLKPSIESTGTVSADNAIVLVWQKDEDGNESNFIITDYEVGGSPACWRSYFGLKCRRNPSPRRAPVLSTDGRASITGQDLSFEQGEFYALQAVNSTVSLPSWATPVGNAYRLTKSNNAPDFSKVSLQLYYQAQEVPSRANHLKIYAYDENEARWVVQETSKIEGAATALSSAIPEGSDELLFIILATTITPSLREGWNLFAYPDVAAQPVAEALDSLDPTEFGCDTYCYTSVYQYQAEEGWMLFDQTVPAAWTTQVNGLQNLEPLNSYWIYATQTITPTINPTQRTVNSVQTFELPPATYYGTVISDVAQGFDPTAGDIVEAQINGDSCGKGELFTVNGQLGYTVQVQSYREKACGEPGDPVTFVVDGTTMAGQAVWANEQACYRPLTLTLNAAVGGDCNPPNGSSLQGQ